jgi:hypothetical protein
LASVSEGQTARVGIVEGTRKLVLPLEWCEPQLFDVTAPDPDEVDLAAAEPARTLGLISQLLGSPAFVGAYEEIQRARAGAQ